MNEKKPHKAPPHDPSDFYFILEVDGDDDPFKFSRCIIRRGKKEMHVGMAYHLQSEIGTLALAQPTITSPGVMVQGLVAVSFEVVLPGELGIMKVRTKKVALRRVRLTKNPE